MSQYYKSVLGNKVLQRTTQYHIVLGSTTTMWYEESQRTTQHYYVLQSRTVGQPASQFGRPAGHEAAGRPAGKEIANKSPVLSKIRFMFWYWCAKDLHNDINDIQHIF